jgi:hypothetical protein
MRSSKGQLILRALVSRIARRSAPRPSTRKDPLHDMMTAQGLWLRQFTSAGSHSRTTLKNSRAQNAGSG